MNAQDVGLPVLDSRSAILAYALLTHQLDAAAVFRDAILTRILPLRGNLVPESVSDADAQSAMQLQVALCHRYAEDVAFAAADSGISQLVILDAGLDTLCYRRSYPTMRLYEVDAEQTQRWKRQNLAVSGVVIPPTLSYIDLKNDQILKTADFERAGYDFGASTLVVWLDSTMFLPHSAIIETLDWLDQHRNHVEFIFSYLQPPATVLSETGVAIGSMIDFMAKTNSPLVSFKYCGS